MREKTDGFWKEAIIKLQKDEEFEYVVKNENSNCILIRNQSDANITASTKSCTPEISILPGDTGAISRPFPLRYVYLRANKPASIILIETLSQDPISNTIQQEVIEKVEVQNKVLNVAYEDAFKILTAYRRTSEGNFSITLDTGLLGRPIVNIFFSAGGQNSSFYVDVSHDNKTFFERMKILNTLDTTWGAYFNDNAFRYIRARMETLHNDNIIIISATR